MKRIILLVLFLIVVSGCSKKEDERAIALSANMNSLLAISYALADSNGVIPSFGEGLYITSSGRVDNSIMIISGNDIDPNEVKP